MNAEEQRRYDIGQRVLELFGAHGRQPTEEMLAAYVKALRPCDLERIEYAFDEAIDLRWEGPPPAWKIAQLAGEWQPPPAPRSKQLTSAGKPAEWSREQVEEAERLRALPFCSRCGFAEGGHQEGCPGGNLVEALAARQWPGSIAKDGR